MDRSTEPCSGVAVRPRLHFFTGQLSVADLRAVSQWVALNEAAILDHWSDLTDKHALGQQLRRLP
jgi:hypothetical protein